MGECFLSVKKLGFWSYQIFPPFPDALVQATQMLGLDQLSRSNSKLFEHGL